MRGKMNAKELLRFKACVVDAPGLVMSDQLLGA